MAWVKRNLYFLIGGAVAVGLLALAGFYFYSKWNLNNETLGKLDAAYSEWRQVSNKKPNAGNDSVDNIKLAKQEEEQVADVIGKVRQRFDAAPPIPAPEDGKVPSKAFAGALRRTLVQLRHDAEVASVKLPPDNYAFSFKAQQNLYTFAPGSLEPLAQQLGDVKVICEILFDAKINMLENLRRAAVSTDDAKGNQSDYLQVSAVTNDLAVLAPYEITFESFSPELADVLAGFANQTYGFIVQTINVEPGSPGMDQSSSGGMTQTPGANYYQRYQAAQPRYAPQPQQISEAQLRARAMERYSLPSRRPAPVYQQPYYGGAQTAARAAAPQVVLEERKLKITMVVLAVRLLPKQ